MINSPKFCFIMCQKHPAKLNTICCSEKDYVKCMYKC